MKTKEQADEVRTGPTAESATAAEEMGSERGCQECPVREWADAFREVEGTMRELLPPAFWQHRRAAHKEALLAVRSLLDAAIERVDREPDVRTSRAPKKIVVQ